MIRLVAILTAAVIGLTACSSENPKFKPGLALKGAIERLNLKKEQTPQGNPFAALTRAQLKGLPGPLLAAHLEKTNAYASLNPMGRNGDIVTLVSPDQITVSLRKGILISTRGLAGDLLASQPGKAVHAIYAAKPDTYRRSYKWLDGEDHVITSHFICELAFVDTATVVIVERHHRTGHWRESCRNESTTVVNDYWIGNSDRVIWQSRQWVGPDTGHIDLTVLIRD